MDLSVTILLDDGGLCFRFNVSCIDRSLDLQCGPFVCVLFGAWC